MGRLNTVVINGVNILTNKLRLPSLSGLVAVDHTAGHPVRSPRNLSALLGSPPTVNTICIQGTRC